jgi:protein arginine kinase activator
MLCEDCGKKKATLMFTEIVDDQQKVYHLCEECAEKRGLAKPKSSWADLLLGLAKGLSAEVKKEEEKLICTCGLTFAEFRRGGKLGCVECYSTFSEKLKPLLQRIHGATKHVGKIATKDEEYLRIKRNIVKLEEQLKRAVTKEDFETAAKIRDQIREYETFKSKKKKSRD